ncbi:hypothetical protein HOY82DRAFT_617571 [Tuber indicum]|nr:hypothetical protein HOY82DRAFT_617571 [Tuber indicum]
MAKSRFTRSSIGGEEQRHEGGGTGAQDSDVENSKYIDKEHGVSANRFHELDKTVSILSVKIDTVRRDVNNVMKKLDRLLYAILDGVVLKGGFDLFRDECNWNRSHSVKET